MDLYHKIQNKSQTDIEKILITKRTEIIEVVNCIREKYQLIIQRFNSEIQLIDKEVYCKIEKVLMDNVTNIYSSIQTTVLNMTKEVIGEDTINAFNKELNISKSQLEQNGLISNSKETV